MDKNNSNNSNNNFFSGFLLGALVGAAVVFLLGTKKGKRLLEAISKEDIGDFSNIFEEANRPVDVDEVIEEKESTTQEVKPKVRRFFRGISRRVN